MRAPSAISRTVAQLEAALGTPLFERHTPALLPTRAGELAAERHARIEQHLMAVLHEARAAGGAPTLAAAEQLFDERLLQAASLLAELQSMPAVGQAMGIRQPAVSMAIKRLEGALQHSLFRRGSQGLQPHTLGVRWIRRFDLALAELRYLADDIAALSGSLQGQIVIGSLPLMRIRVLPMAIAEVLHAHPQLRVHVLESPYEVLRVGLQRGRVDAILGALRPTLEADLISEPLFEDRLGVMAAATHPLARRRQLRLADLRGQPWVLSRPGTPLRASLVRYFAQAGEPPPQASVETGDQALVRGLLLGAGMLTVLSTHQLQYEIGAGDVCVLPVDLRGLTREIGLTLRREARLPPGALALLDAIRTQSRVVDAG